MRRLIYIFSALLLVVTCFTFAFADRERLNQFTSLVVSTALNTVKVSTGTVDGADNKRLILCGGTGGADGCDATPNGALDASGGAVLSLQGNEAAGAGDVLFYGGSKAGSDLSIYTCTAGSCELKLNSNATEIYTAGGTSIATFSAAEGLDMANVANTGIEFWNTSIEMQQSGILDVRVFGSDVANFDSGGINLTDGTAAAPSMSFSSDTDTGIYADGTGKVSIAANGTRYARVSSQGLRVKDSTSVNLGSVTTDTGLAVNGSTDLGVFLAATEIIDINTGGVAINDQIFLNAGTTVTGSSTVLCRTSSGSIGECSSTVGASGTCTCN